MSKSERQLNLVFRLINTRYGLTRKDLRTNIPEYANATSDISFERMFERDKDDIRQMGFRLISDQNINTVGDEVRYKILEDLSLVDIENITPIERIVLGLAYLHLSRSNIRNTSLLRKLESANLPDYPLIDDIHMKPDFETIQEGISNRKNLGFKYQDQNLNNSDRHVSPVTVHMKMGLVYLIAFDRLLKEYRAFRVDRMKDVELKEDYLDELDSTDKIQELDKLLGFEGPKITIQLAYNSDVDPFLGYFTSVDSSPTTNIYHIYPSEKENFFRELAYRLGDFSISEPAEIRDEFVEFLNRRNTNAGF